MRRRAYTDPARLRAAVEEAREPAPTNPKGGHMSWSISAIGKAPAVLKAVEQQSSQDKCNEPEETVRQAAYHAIKEALIAQGPNVVVKLSAVGSQSDWNGVVQNQLSIQIDPQYRFVE